MIPVLVHDRLVIRPENATLTAFPRALYAAFIVAKPRARVTGLPSRPINVRTSSFLALVKLGLPGMVTLLVQDRLLVDTVKAGERGLPLLICKVTFC